jgi:hypothetical protein
MISKPVILKETGRAASGAIIKRIVPAPGVASPREKPAAAGAPQGPQHWPRPTPGAKLGAIGVLERLASIGGPLPRGLGDDISKHLATMNLPNRAPAALPIRKLNPAEIDRAGWEHVKARGKLTGPAERPADWPQGQPWYPGLDLSPALARAIVAAEQVAAAAAR